MNIKIGAIGNMVVLTVPNREEQCCHGSFGFTHNWLSKRPNRLAPDEGGNLLCEPAGWLLGTY